MEIATVINLRLNHQMKIRTTVAAFIIQLIVTGCGVSKQLKENRTLLKEYAYCKCFQYATGDTAFFRNDVSLSVYREISHYYPEALDTIDSLSKQAALRIKPSIIADYGNRKAILQNCFLFYESKLVDSVVRRLDKLSCKSW
jgi:hypothetical protein